MYDLCFGPLCFAFVLGIAALAGYGLWVLLASILGTSDASDTAGSRLPYQCVGCGHGLEAPATRCHNCRLELSDKDASEVRRLAQTAQTIRQLAKQRTLDPDRCAEILDNIEKRRLELASPLLRPNVVGRLEAWFADALGQSMSSADKKQALALSKTLSPAQLRELPPRALIGLARLLTSLGLLNRTSRVYLALYERHPSTPLAEEEEADALWIAQLAHDKQLIDLLTGHLGLIEDASSEPPLVELAEPTPEEPTSSPATEPETPTHPPRPRRSFAEWIAVFMEDRNILWGELIGGTLIVGCSIALVISLWETLAEIQYFPFLILAATTAALFGAGFYTLHHWKLESTSRGLLLIGILMIPLDFVVFAGLTRFEQAGLLEWLMGTGALAVFGFLILRSSRILVETPLDIPAPSARLVTLSTLTSAAALCLAPAWVGHHSWSEPAHYALSLIAVAVQCAALAWILHRLAAIDSWSLSRIVALLIALGSTTFAVGVTLGFLLYTADVLSDALVLLSPAMTLLGFPLLLTGTLIHRQLEHENDETFALWRTIGTGIALFGGFVMFGGFAAGFDSPGHRWFTGLANIATFLAAASLLRVPVLHVPAQAYPVVLLALGGRADPSTLLDTATPALRLACLFIVQALAGEIFARQQRLADARWYALASGVTTVLSIVLILPHSTETPASASLVLGLAALTGYASNLRWRLASITYSASVVLLGATFFAFCSSTNLPLLEQWMWSLLAHSTICALIDVLLRRTEGMRSSFHVPLALATLTSSLAATALLIAEQLPPALPATTSSLVSLWLASLWLTLALLERRPSLFAAFQLSLGFAWLFAAGDMLTDRGWDWREPLSLQVYALGLAVLCLGWELTRTRLRSNLLSPSFPPMDRLMSAFVVIAQYAIAILVVLWSVGLELSTAPHTWRVFPESWHREAFSPWAWLVPLTLAVALLLWLRNTAVRTPMLGLVLLMSTLPILAAGTWFHTTNAAASALRWGLAACYALASLLLWLRHRLGEPRAVLLPIRSIRTLLLVAALLPVLALTAYVTVQKLSGAALPGPDPSSIFLVLGGPASLILPLALLSVSLGGHGLRERLDYYLLGAGLLLTTTAVGTFFLALQQLTIPFDRTWVTVDALLLAGGTAWLCSILWVRLATKLEPDKPRPLLDSPLLLANSALATILFVSVLLPALYFIVSRSADSGVQWAQEVGSLRGWIAFALLAGGATLLTRARRPSLTPHLHGALGLTTVGMLAASFASSSMPDAYVALMLGSALFACLWVGSSLPDQRLLVEYSAPAIVLAILLAGQALFVAEHRLWSTAAMTASALALGLLGHRQQREIWATLASLAMVPAGILLVLHADPDNPHLTCCVILTATATLGAMSLLRLAFPQWIDQSDTEPKVTQLDQLLSAGMIANTIVLLTPFVALFVDPIHPNRVLGVHTDHTGYLLVSGWLALLTNAVAVVWRLVRVHPRSLVHVAGIVAILVGVGLAVSTDLVFDQARLAHHTLTVSWLVAALLLLASSWRQGWLPEAPTHFWTTLLGVLVLAFSTRAAWIEPGLPSWPIANTLAVSTLLGAVAIRTRTPGYVFASGLLLPLVALLLWAAHRPPLLQDRYTTFAFAQIIGLGLASILWSLVERKCDLTGHLPFTQTALQVGLHLLALVVVLANAVHLAGRTIHLNAILGPTSVAVLALATIIDGVRPRFRTSFSYPLYLSGLSALGLLLHAQQLPAHDWRLAAMLMLAGYVLLVVLIARPILTNPRWQTWLGSSSAHSGWFWHTQLATIAIVFALSMWTTLTYPTWPLRMLGSLAVAMLALTAYLLTSIWPTLYPNDSIPTLVSHRLFPHHLTLALVVLAGVEAGLGGLGFDVPVLGMQRTSAAFIVLVVALLAYRLALPRWIEDGPWADASSKNSAFLALTTLAVLVVFLAEQLLLYDGRPNIRRTPQLFELAILSTLALLGLVGFALWSALTKRPDPFGLESDRRSIYIYSMELLAIAFVAHLRLNIPKLIPPVLGRYWYLSVMVLAFAMVPLGEVLHRRRLPIVAVPLHRSSFVLAFVPVVAFRFAALFVVPQWLLDAIPGLVPFNDYLLYISSQYHMEALCWLLLGIFFAWQARLRDTANYGIVGLFAVNFGLWVLLGHQNATTFLERPQLWLIPLGLIVLVAEHVNRDRLGFWPSLSVRYAGLTCIYLSSMIEIFVENLDPLFAIILAVIAVAGMLLGILFRVRAFLFAGFVALLVAVGSQIWHAAVVHELDWVWWASGIALGVLIIALFALFEKHKNEVLDALDSMKQWD